MTNLAACPICKSEAKLLDKMGDTTGFDCPKHGRFRVAGSVLATRGDASREKWEAALKRAKEAKPNEWAPLITTYVFD